MVISSTCSARCGKTSLISMPLLPCGANLNGDGNAAPGRVIVLSMSLIDLPAYLARAGLGSNVSTCDGPPAMNRWMTCLALPGNCGARGASGERRLASARAVEPATPRHPSTKPAPKRPCPCRNGTRNRAGSGTGPQAAIHVVSVPSLVEIRRTQLPCIQRRPKSNDADSRRRLQFELQNTRRSPFH